MPNHKLTPNKSGKYWIFVSVGIIVNIFIFSFLSRQLEEKILNDFIARLPGEDLISLVSVSEPE